MEYVVRFLKVLNVFSLMVMPLVIYVLWLQTTRMIRAYDISWEFEQELSVFVIWAVSGLAIYLLPLIIYYVVRGRFVFLYRSMK